MAIRPPGCNAKGRLTDLPIEGVFPYDPTPPDLGACGRMRVTFAPWGWGRLATVAGVIALDLLTELRAVDVGIDLRRGDILVSEQ